MSTRVRIGVTANFFHADPERKVFRHKTLQYLEERMALALARAGAVPVLMTDLKDDAGTDALLDVVDGLVLAGGADVSPHSYGQDPLRPEWSGDAIRDAYEIRLIAGARERGLPVLGVCRGIQVLNVAFGGTLWQDISTQKDGAPPLRATAWAPDGIIEAAECIDDRGFVVGVQWHPEWLELARVQGDPTAAGRTTGDPLFTAFVSICRERAQG
jgi:gamma-glutamyl-gamma-aminobutyrate hydrolase PuuD